MKKSHFVVVVGGGPAGSSAAYTLAKQGIDVCIIDKSTFPRNKLCGGLLTLRSKKVFEEIFDADWKKNYEYRSSGFKILNKNTVLNGATASLNNGKLQIKPKNNFFKGNLNFNKGPILNIDIKGETGVSLNHEVF